VALNQQVVDEMLGVGVAKGKILRIPNGVDIELDGHRRAAVLDESIVIAFVGRLHPQKRVAMLLQALKLALQQRPDLAWQLKLAGTGPLERDLKALADELSIGRQVEFLGHVADVGALLDRSDLFVLPSASEGISNALLEAMAHGLPCIVTDIPGNNEVIQNGQNGILVKVDDAQALAGAILGLATDAELRERLGRQARRTVETKYLLASVTAQYIQLYERLLLDGRGR
jgi:glycosyltransferase involved in cell wall biosynthesis